jgi:hypothetical protein
MVQPARTSYHPDPVVFRMRHQTAMRALYVMGVIEVLCMVFALFHK